MENRIQYKKDGERWTEEVKPEARSQGILRSRPFLMIGMTVPVIPIYLTP